MSHELIIRPEAEEDIDDAYLWYERQRMGLGGEFLVAVQAAIAEIERRPVSFAVVHKAVRRALCRRFPYCFYFQLEGERIIVIAVYHAKRAPWRWQRRL